MEQMEPDYIFSTKNRKMLIYDNRLYKLNNLGAIDPETGTCIAYYQCYDSRCGGMYLCILYLYIFNF